MLRAGAHDLAPVLPQLLHASVDFADAFDGELAVDYVEGVGRIGDDAGEAANVAAKLAAEYAA